MIFESVNNATLPRYMHPNDVSMDASVREDTIIPACTGPTVRIAVPLGFKVNLAETSEDSALQTLFKMHVRPRSGCSLEGMPGIELNAIGNPVSEFTICGFDADVVDGTIDPDYTDEVMCIIHSRDPRSWMIPAGTRICQCEVSRLYQAKIEEGIVESNENRKGGFESSKF